MQYEAIFGTTKTPNWIVGIYDTVENGALTNRTTKLWHHARGPGNVNTMYYHLQLYFANGGGPCYIISVEWELLHGSPEKYRLIEGIDAAKKMDDISLLVIPEATSVYADEIPELATARAEMAIAETAYQQGEITATAYQEAQSNFANAYNLGRSAAMCSIYKAGLAQCAQLKNRFLVMDCLPENPELIRDASYGIGTENLSYGAAYYPQLNTDIHILYEERYSFIQQFVNGTAISGYQMLPNIKNANNELYQLAIRTMSDMYNTLPPCSAIAAVYASTDRTHGVWKAPANTSLNRVTGTAVEINDEDQAQLNIDPVAGKSINAIRNFAGKGTVVWGARTLAGNSNEWRYVSVRRLFSMVETSIRNAVENFVFENNDANTWTKVQVMIESYLTGLWREGALQGARPGQAFYVAVGLGKTMTAQDVLEGKMIVEVGMAAVRPAEFIILRFSHRMATS